MIAIHSIHFANQEDKGMHGRWFSRREALGIGLFSVLGGLAGCKESGGGGNNNVGNAVGDAMIAIGTVSLTIPHPVGKIIGAALTSGGSILKIYMALADGTTKEEEVTLTKEDAQKVAQALKEGKTFTVSDSKRKDRPIATK